MHRALLFLLAGLCWPVAGCHDGPLYALKYTNPFLVKQWRQQEALGITDHQRREELELLVRSLPRMSAAEQAEWLPHLERMVDNDASADMRYLVVRATGPISDPQALRLLENALSDDSLKVRMAACDELGHRKEGRAAELLAKMAGESTNLDIRQAALRSLGNHRGPGVNEAMKLALADRDPAVRMTAIKALQSSTGRQLGTQPEVWLAYLDGDLEVPEPPGLTDRIRSWF